MSEKGYEVNITTWENDGDNYKTQSISGLTREQVPMYVELAKFFESGTNNKAKGPDGRGNYGNADVEGCWGEIEPQEDALHGKERYRVCFDPATFNKEFLDFCKDNKIDSEDYNEDNTVDEIIGTWCEGEYMRVVEDVNVLFYPEASTDVTKDFI